MKTNRTTINNKEEKDEQRQDMGETILWTVGEAAKYLNVCEGTIRRDINSGELPHLRIRGCIRVPKQAVSDWVESQIRYNSRCAGLAVRHPKGERKCLNSAKRRKVSTGVKEVGTGGHLTQRQAVGEFNALLGQPPRGKR
jgi:excisionase family DNA binding protein